MNSLPMSCALLVSLETVPYLRVHLPEEINLPPFPFFFVTTRESDTIFVLLRATSTMKLALRRYMHSKVAQQQLARTFIISIIKKIARQEVEIKLLIFTKVTSNTYFTLYNCLNL